MHTLARTKKPRIGDAAAAVGAGPTGVDRAPPRVIKRSEEWDVGERERKRVAFLDVFGRTCSNGKRGAFARRARH